jgi:DUF4097 and DUF4098 domain-containing protein YvlB
MGAAVAAVAITVATPALGAEQTWNWSGTITAGKAIEIKDVNGGISASLGRADWDGTLKLTTVNGGIEVRLPSSASIDVKARTVNGDIETDFPLTVKGKIGRRRIEGSIGGGGPLLEMETVNGSIELKKS